MRYTPREFLARAAVVALFLALLALAIVAGISESAPKPPHWERRCSHSHEEPYMVMETQPSAGGAPGGAYPVIHYTTVCDAYVRVWVTDPRWRESKK